MKAIIYQLSDSNANCCIEVMHDILSIKVKGDEVIITSESEEIPYNRDYLVKIELL